MQTGRDPLTKANVFTRDDVHPLILDLMTLRLFGTEWIDWEPEVVRTAIKRETGQSLSRLNNEALQAVKTVHAEPGVVLNAWEAFVPVVLALNKDLVYFDQLVLPTMRQLTAAAVMLKALEPELEWGEEVKKFSASLMLSSGQFFAPPDELGFLQPLLSGMYYTCPFCGYREDVTEEHDGICDNCGKNWWKGLDKNVARNNKVRFSFQRDPGPCLALYRMLEDGKYETFAWDDDHPVHVQVARALAASVYSDELQQQFLRQKKELRL